MSTFPNHCHVKSPFPTNIGLLSISPACFGQLVKILTTLEAYGIIWIKFCIFIILILSSIGMQNGDEGFSANTHNS